jgi:hypothetical protein
MLGAKLMREFIASHAKSCIKTEVQREHEI